jgi:zinc transport system ATP-binding protein
MSESLIEVNDVFVSYGKIQALKSLTFTIEKGDYIGVIGPNGGGKSTLIKTILGLVKTNQGSISYLGQPYKKSKIKMGYVPQINDINRYFPITVKEVVLTGKLSTELIPLFKYTKNNLLEVKDILELVGLGDLGDRQISDLSGGEFQKMLIARALIIKPDILLLDEPTAMIDILSQKQILNLLKKLSKDVTILLVTHQIQAITKHVKKLMFLNKNVLAEGNPDEVYKYAYLNQTHFDIRKKYGKEVDLNV